ncbi:hypothetical protein [Lacticaseibacillus rhamnosus]|nr:hypothetical protein [Lacticaseibacillus rhamnosus]
MNKKLTFTVTVLAGLMLRKTTILPVTTSNTVDEMWERHILPER